MSHFKRLVEKPVVSQEEPIDEEYRESWSKFNRKQRRYYNKLLKSGIGPENAVDMVLTWGTK